ncbi:MAG: molybdenum cofactor guanylyltransferase [Melioribacter sp.]|nr:molybdenum cofactor guanylyltransferase [Melioribacter sp.]
MYKDITGVILAGGKSLRMGMNKSFLKFNGVTIIERIVNLMKYIFEEVIIISNTPHEYLFLGVPVYEDIFKDKGPLAGIHSGLFYARNEKIFVISCDVPLMTEQMINYIVNFQTDKPIKICRASGYLQPLVGIYSKSLINSIEKVLTQNLLHDKSLHSFLDNIEAEIINPENLDFYKDEFFFNINSPEDYQYLISIENKKVLDN